MRPARARDLPRDREELAEWAPPGRGWAFLTSHVFRLKSPKLMSGTLLLLAVTVCGVVVGLMWLMAMYNGLLTARQKSSGLFSRIEAQLARRHALLRDLTETAQSISSIDRPALDAFVSAQSEAHAALAAASAPVKNADALGRLLAAESHLDSALARFLGVLERQPAWSTNPYRSRFTEDIASAENENAILQTAYNESVTAYNERIQEIPALWIALLTGLSREIPLQTAARVEPESPKTRFSASA
jgi:LemA protein